MRNASKKRILTWILAVCVAGIFLLISSCNAEKPVNPNRTTILINAPEPMVIAFNKTFDKLNLDKDYIIEATDDITKANFVVREGMNEEGKLIAYSPIVAVFNADDVYKNDLIQKGIFVTSEFSSSYVDFDFNKVIQEAVSEKGCEFKVYYPSKDSDSWDEFYHFMLFTVNDGYYPGTVEEMQRAKQITNEFLNSKYAEPFNNNTVERNNGIPKNSIYFMAYADLARVYKQSGGFTCRVMYPKTVVYHSYYATYDELGKVIYDSLEEDYVKFHIIFRNAGFRELRKEGYNTKYSTDVSNIGSYVYGVRSIFNGVEIPGTEIPIFEEEQ